LEFTRTLTEIGFSTAGSNLSGHQHRWIRGDASIDILIAAGLGERGARRRGVTGAMTLTSLGMQQALDRTANSLAHLAHLAHLAELVTHGPARAAGSTA
jgi:hypothetical protein